MHGDPLFAAPKPLHTKKSSNGYILIYRPDHTNSQKDGYILEHRQVMSEILMRPLLPKEEVHHKNKIRDDNRPSNLELWTTSQPPGGRVEDLLEWAVELIDLYSDKIDDITGHLLLL